MKSKRAPPDTLESVTHPAERCSGERCHEVVDRQIAHRDSFHLPIHVARRVGERIGREAIRHRVRLFDRLVYAAYPVEQGQRTERPLARNSVLGAMV